MAGSPSSTPNLRIKYTHVPTNQTVEFQAFLETFSDAYSSEWSSEKVFGRMDPIAQYKGTGRVLTFSFTVPSFDSQEALQNHLKISKLMQFMYPTYEGNTEVDNYVITAPPLMLVKFNNLIQNEAPVSVGADGLLGYIPDVKYEPDMNSNIFNLQGEKYNPAGADDATNKVVNPLLAFQSFKINTTLNVLHTHRLGWGTTKKTDGTISISPARPLFPYGYDILK